MPYICTRKSHHARVAELVDAPVSNTGGVTLVPVRSRPRVQKKSLVDHESTRLFLLVEFSPTNIILFSQ